MYVELENGLTVIQSLLAFSEIENIYSVCTLGEPATVRMKAF